MQSFVYTCESSVIDPLRVGTTQQIDFKAQKFQRMQNNDLQWSESINHQTREPTSWGSYTDFNIYIPYIPASNYLNWREFYESVQDGSQFTADATDVVTVGGLIVLTAEELNLPEHIKTCNLFTVSIKARQVL